MKRLNPKSISLNDAYAELVKLVNTDPERLMKMSSGQLEQMIKVVRYKLRGKCRSSLYFLAKYIIGFKDMSPEFHKPICKAVQAVNPYVVQRNEISEIPHYIRDRLWMLFRGAFKTSIITVAHTIQLLLLDSELRVAIASNKLAHSKEMLGIIKNVFMFNEFFRFLFPEYCPQPSPSGKIEWGTQESVTLPNRKSLTLKEGSIECAGVDTGLVSRHYDYQKKDDLVTDKSVTTEEQIEASINWDRLSLSLFDNPEKGFNDWIGSRYDDRDMYGKLLQRPKEDITIITIPIYNEDNTINFPERFTKRGIEKIREDQGEYIFSCQYMLDPIPLKDRKFRNEWLEHYYDKLPDLFAICIHVDPANSRKKTAKYTAIVVHAVTVKDGKKTWYLVDGVFDKLGPADRVNALFRLARKWKYYLRLVSYETIGFQETDQVFLESKMKEENFFFHIDPIPSQEVSKLGRIEGLAPLYEYGKILLPKKLPYYSLYHRRPIDLVQVLKYELTRFAQATHLDFADAQAQMLDFQHVYPLKRSNKPKIEPGSFFWFRDKMKRYKQNPHSRIYPIEEVFDKV